MEILILLAFFAIVIVLLVGMVRLAARMLRGLGKVLSWSPKRAREAARRREQQRELERQRERAAAESLSANLQAAVAANAERSRLWWAAWRDRKRKAAQRRRFDRCCRNVRRMEDFGPVIAEAQLARDLSPEDKQRVFYRHRPRFIDHAVACLQSNMTRRSVVSEVEDLVLACAVNKRQVDYIIGAAEARLAKEPDFHSTLLDEIRLHKQRVRSIQELHDDPEIVEELLEIEQARHAQAVQRLSGVNGGGMPGGF